VDKLTPDWASSPTNTAEKNNPAFGADRSTAISRLSSAAIPASTSSLSARGMEMSSHLAPSPQRRTYTHRAYRFFKFITISVSLFLIIAQVISVVYLPFDGVELGLKFFLSSFGLLTILNELECWGALRESPLLWNFISRGYFYAFIALVSVEENNIKPPSLSADLPALLFIECSSWMMFVIGVLYMLFGMCCGQRFLIMIKADYLKRLEEQKKMAEEGVQINPLIT